MTSPQRPLAHFRAELYQTFGLRRDALLDLLDAVLTGERVSSVVRLSLAPAFRRRWPSIFDALTDGTLDVSALRRLVGRSLPPPPPETRLLWAIDGSTWPRPEARTSPERTCCRFVTPGIPESGIMPGWEYQWLVAIPEPSGSWVLPLDVTRRGPQAGTATHLAIAQLQAALATRRYPRHRPVVVLDSHYDVPALVGAVSGIDLLARLASNRVFYRAPPVYTGTGRPRVHGPVFRLRDPATQDRPDRRQTDPDPDYGQVTIDVWDHLHKESMPPVELTVLRVAVAHLPRRTVSSTGTVVAGLAWGSPAGRSARGLALVSTAVCGRACLPLSQAGPGLDRGPAPVPADRGSLELAAGQCALGAVAGPGPGRRCPLAVGTAHRPRAPQSGPGAAGDAWACGQLGHPSPPTSSTRKVAGTTRR